MPSIPNDIATVENEITPEMLEAGTEALLEAPFCEVWPPFRAAEVAREVYLAMNLVKSSHDRAQASRVTRLRVRAK